jgi:hypothetical protein
MLVEVDVQRRAHAVPQLVLEVGEARGELADVVVVHERQGGDRRHGLGDARAYDPGADPIAQDLGAGRLSSSFMRATLAHSS